MRKKCVRWTKSVRSALVAAAAIATALVVTPLAQTADPSGQAKLVLGDIMYIGGFRLPAEPTNGDSFSFGGKQLTFNPAGNSLFVGSRAGRVAEISIPSPVNSSNPAAMPFATYLQPFSDPTEGRLSQITGEGVALDSLMVYGNRLYGTASIYYDANGVQRVSHYSHSLQLNEPSFSGWSSVWAADKTGFVSGAMAVVPSEWRATLGGPAATGQCCIPIVMRTSWGPSAFAFDPTQIGQANVAASPLLYYPGDHPTLGAWDNANPTYGATIQMGGLAIIAGTRTALYIGRIGSGHNCYGNGTADASLVGSMAADGAHYCYDPTSNDKGSHAYPYHYQIWAYDLNDFAAVKAGSKQPWDVIPYGVWPFDFPTTEQSVKIGGVGYDSATQRLYVSQLLADRDGYANRPIVHVLQINAAGAPDNAASQPLPTTTPSPAPDNSTTKVTAITLAVDRNSPQVLGTAITFTANPVGGATPLQYKWLVFNGSDWQPATNWSTLDSFRWTPGSANANYRVGVWARSAGNNRDEAEASVSTAFAITQPSSQPVQSLTISSDKTSPQNTTTQITFLATPAGGSGPVEYKWMVYDGSPTWQQPTGWTTKNTFTWTPTTAFGEYEIRVWARSIGATKDEPQADVRMSFAVQTPAPVLVTAATLSASKTAPQTAGTAITLMAGSSGGVAPVQYKFLLYDGSPNWQHVTGWTSSNVFSWKPTSANADYAIRVWARSGTSTADAPEAEAQLNFPITAVPRFAVSSVTLDANKTAPQNVGTPVTFYAAAAGAVQYKFLVYDGSPTWTFVTNWTSNGTFTWTPASANSGYRVRVWARSALSTTDAPEAEAEVGFAINGVTAPPVTGVTLTTNKPAPQPSGTAVVATATVTGGSTALQYRWLIHDGTQWNIVTGWSSSNTFTWTPTAANEGHFIGVWVRNAANTNGDAEATRSLPFPIK